MTDIASTAGALAARPARTERLTMRVDPGEKAVLEQAARIEKQSLTDFVLSSARREAERLVGTQQSLQLSEQDTLAFIAALFDPPRFSPRLEQALERHARQYGDR